MEQQLSQVTPLIIGLLIGLVLGAGVVWLILRRLTEMARSQAKSESQIEIARLEERAGRLPALETQLAENVSQSNSRQEENTRIATQLAERSHALESLEGRLSASEAERKADLEKLESLRSRLQEETNRATTLTEHSARLAEVEKALSSATTENQQLRTQVAEMTITLDGERKQGAEKLVILNEAKEQLSDRFKSLANEILEEKAKRFTEQNKTNIGQILEPLKTKLQEFQGKVEEVYVQEGKDRTALAEQVKQLMTLNQQLSQDAHDLTQALKGSSKTQGNWGELILERVLEASGLRKGYEYDVRESHAREDGSRAQPDVVIHLPEGKHLVVDSKVSLTAYEEYSNADNEVAREAAITRHLDSVRAHIKELSEKNYQGLYDLKTLDFTIMFVPVEPAFMLAIANDNKVWEDAWKKNVIVVSPSTLLFVLRTVAYLWRQEQQNRNVQEIAKRGAELYDKLVGFVEDFNKLGERLTQAKESYDSAYGKFSRGRGNVIRQAEMLKDLGVKPSKSLPQTLVELDSDEPLALPSVAEGGAQN